MPDVSAFTNDPAATGGVIGSIVAIIGAIAVYVEKRLKTDRRVDRLERAACANPELCAEKMETLSKAIGEVRANAAVMADKVSETHADVRVLAAKMDWLHNGRKGPYPMIEGDRK